MAAEEALLKRALPHSIEAEQSVIGSMILDREAITIASELIFAEDFYNKQYGVLFESMVELNDEGKPVDLVTLQDKLKASLESVREAFGKVVEKYGRIDILVNNAGISERTPFTQYTEEVYDKVMDLNVKGVFTAARVAAEYMEKQGGGVILTTSSMVSIYGQPAGFAYPASKFAVNGMTLSLARELGPKGIRVNAVAPGITETDMMKAVPKSVIEPMIAQIPLRRLGQPEDIANAFVFLASDEASYITGVVLSVDGMARS